MSVLDIFQYDVRPFEHWLGRLAAERVEREDSLRGALQKVKMAILGTRRHLATQAAANNLWREASDALEHFAPDLAVRCFQKADYWAAPFKWERAEIERARITLDGMFDDVCRLLAVPEDGDQSAQPTAPSNYADLASPVPPTRGRPPPTRCSPIAGRVPSRPVSGHPHCRGC